jgi:hypothetical protein
MSQTEFPLTRWSEVTRVRDEDPEVANAALARLVMAYDYPLLRYLQRQYRVDEDQAREWLQAFLHERVVQGKLLARARRERGRLRGFLCQALRRFVISVLRKQQAQRCSPANGAPLSIDELPEAVHPHAQANADWAFDVDWARTLLARVLEAMAAECLAKGAHQRWELFRVRWVDPLLRGAGELPYAELVVRFGFKSPSQAHNAWVTAARMFRRILEETLIEDGGTPETVAEDIETFIAVLRAAGTDVPLSGDTPESTG